MKTIYPMLALSLMLGGLSTGGAAATAFYDKAKVIRSTPIYETVRVARPEERCWDEKVYSRSRSGGDSFTPAIAGAIVGGVVGNQFGKGHGKDAMTVAGALLGASVGRDLYRSRGGRRHGGYVLERRCETVDRYVEEERIVGYRVKYRYRGRTFTTRTLERPGKRLRIRVELEPTARYAFNDRR
ncbi:MAG TPA: glycine zipper 2TM domain-containing protein [Sedimenticola thiotaurini]|uniref:Glycine zipper 2TM domain-containing protein n=1 Tax=Sedimenticola thiotaurini TaxID=1543721 RepID=A0A831RM45_9GAMM|nr:glycine zipper 2TM domain-containing protein [Sedimenticola thiotaurini]